MTQNGFLHTLTYFSEQYAANAACSPCATTVVCSPLAPDVVPATVTAAGTAPHFADEAEASEAARAGRGARAEGRLQVGSTLES